MKLPFSIVLTPLIKPYYTKSKLICQHPAFAFSIIYVYIFGTLGLFMNVNYFKNHLGELPRDDTSMDEFMFFHDFKIIATSMSIMQYACLLVGCFTNNPALFLPHIAGQLFAIIIRSISIFVLLTDFNKYYKKVGCRIPSIFVMMFNLCQEICVFRQDDYLIWNKMESESNTLLNQLRMRHENHANDNHIHGESAEGVRMKLRALLVALLGVSVSACAFASQPVELELDDDDVAQRLNNVSFARRITKPTIRLVMGYGKLSAFITAVSSLLLLVAVMSKQSWWHRGARWLAAPALLVAALEAASDAGDAMLAAALRGTAEPGRVIAQTAAAGLLVTVEILVWYFIAKFFEYNPPQMDTVKKETC